MSNLNCSLFIVERDKEITCLSTIAFVQELKNEVTQFKFNTTYLLIVEINIPVDISKNACLANPELKRLYLISIAEMVIILDYLPIPFGKLQTPLPFLRSYF